MILVYYQKKDINSAATDDLHLAHTQLAKRQKELECAIPRMATVREEHGYILHDSLNQVKISTNLLCKYPQNRIALKKSNFKQKTPSVAERF